MSRKLRIALYIVGAVVLVLLVLPFLIPVNQFRPIIEQKASASLGRQVTVGNLGFSIFTGSVNADNLGVSDDPKFSGSPFITAKSIKVGVEVIPLIFSRTLNVTGVTIENPQVNLSRNSAGQWNYSSLGGSSPETKPNTSGGGLPSSAVSISKLELIDGQINIAASGAQKPHTYDHVNVTASNVSATSKFPVTVSAGLPNGGKFSFDGTVGPIDQTDVSLTPLDAKLNVSSLDLASTGLLDPGAGLGGIVDVDAAFASQNGEASTKGTAKVSKALLIAGGSPASEPIVIDFNTTYDLRKNAGVLSASALKIGNATAHLDGTYQIPQEGTVLNIKLNGQNMPAKDLESVLPALGLHLPKGATLQAGTLNADLNLAGLTTKLVTTGNVGLFGATLAGFDLGSQMRAISSLVGIQTGKDLKIDKLTTNVRMAPDGIKADNFIAVVQSLGTLTGAGTIDSKNNLNFKMAATLTNPAAAGTAASATSAAATVLGRFTGGGQNCKNGATVPFMIEGTTSDPKFVPDVGGLAAGLLKTQLGCGGTAPSGGSNGQNPSDLVNGLSGLFGKKKQ